MLSRLWWDDTGWLPGAHQATLLLPFSTAWGGGENMIEMHSGQNKDRSITQKLLSQANRFDLGKLIKFIAS